MDNAYSSFISQASFHSFEFLLIYPRPLIKNEGQETSFWELGGAKIASGAGAGSAGLFRCGKGTTWEGGQRVPGLISYPSKIEPGTSHALTTALDILPFIDFSYSRDTHIVVGYHVVLHL